MSGNILFVRSYPLVSFGHVQNFERRPSDKDVCWVNVSCALVCGLSGSHAPDILYVSVDVHSTRAGERSTSGHVTDKTDEYRMLNGQETHILDAKRWFLRSKQLTFIILWNLKPRLYAQFAPWCKFTSGCKIAPVSKFAPLM